MTPADLAALVAAVVAGLPPPVVAPAAPVIVVANPRVGDVVAVAGHDTPWTGGSNLPHVNALGMCRTAACYRPTSLKGRILTEKTCCTGLSEERRLDTTAGCQVQLATWIRNIKDLMENNGLDTVFRIPNQYGAAGAIVDVAGAENYLLEAWGTVKTADVALFVDTYVPAHGDSYDRDNLAWSARAISDSIGPALWDSVEKESTGSTSGPEMFQLVLGHVQATSAQAVRDLVAALEKLSLSEEPGEDVTLFSNKVSDICRKIDGSGLPPSDLGLIVAKVMATSTVAKFQLTMDALYNDLDDDPSVHTWRDVLLKGKTKYIKLKNASLWTAEMTKKTDELAGLRAELDTLKASMGASHGGQGGRPSGRVCWTCGSTDHISPDCPNKGTGGQTNPGGATSDSNTNNGGAPKSPYRIPPSGAEPHEKVIDGKPCKWCGKCGRWTHGEKLHSTAEHVVRPRPAAAAATTDGAATTEAGNLAVGEATQHHQLVGTFGLFGAIMPSKGGAGRHE